MKYSEFIDPAPVDIEEIIEDALNFYKENGIEIGKKPKVIYSRKQPEKRIAACYISRNKPDLNKIKTHYKNIITQIINEFDDLDTKTALQETIKVMEDLQDDINTPIPEKDFQKYIETGADIIVFPYYYVTSEDSYLILAHEVWHMIEDEAKLLHENITIREGTATYAAITFMKHTKHTNNLDPYLLVPMYLKSNDIENTLTDIITFIHHYFTAGVLEKKLSGHENPLKALLDRKTRDYLEKETLKEILKLMLTIF